MLLQPLCQPHLCQGIKWTPHHPPTPSSQNREEGESFKALFLSGQRSSKTVL